MVKRPLPGKQSYLLYEQVWNIYDYMYNSFLLRLSYKYANEKYTNIKTFPFISQAESDWLI